jgi:hypothetical protein
VSSFFKYVLAMMWGVISEVCADMLKQFVHGFWANEFHPVAEALAYAGLFCLLLVGAILFTAYIMERFFSERGQRVVLIASILATGVLYPPRC